MVLRFSGVSLRCKKVQSTLPEWIRYWPILTSEGSKVGRVHVDNENWRQGLNKRFMKKLSVMFDLAPDSDCSSNTDIARETEVVFFIFYGNLRDYELNIQLWKMNEQKRGPIVNDMNKHTSRHVRI